MISESLYATGTLRRTLHSARGVQARAAVDATCLVRDAGFLTWEPRALGLWAYLSDIWLNHLMIPATTSAVGYTAERKGD
jgi:hypothetical protein